MKPEDKRYYVDRIEGDFAVTEYDGEMTDIPLSELPDGVREGSVLILSDEGFIFDKESESDRKNKLFGKQSLLFKNGSE